MFVCLLPKPPRPLCPIGQLPSRRLPFKNGDPNMAPPGFGSLSGVPRIRPLDKIRPGVGPGICVPLGQSSLLRWSVLGESARGPGWCRFPGQPCGTLPCRHGKLGTSQAYQCLLGTRLVHLGPHTPPGLAQNWPLSRLDAATRFVWMVGHARGASLPRWAVRHGMRQCEALYPRAVCMGLSCMLSAVQRHAKRTTMGSSAGRSATLNGTRPGCSARGLQHTLLVRPP